MPEEPKSRYFVSVSHGLIQEVRNDSNEFEVRVSPDELTVLQDLLKDLAREDDYAFRRAVVPYKSADHDEAAGLFDEGTLRLYHYLHRIGTPETQQTIEQLDVLPKLENTGYQDKGYGEGSPTNK